ncbi:MAG: NAD-dependent DNA ligase LigA [Firmicutes bacterium]|nr:NAD-dependent DNA ligase LigA [Bacillota bacterium]
MNERMSELVKILNQYCYHYYVLDNPIVSDAEFDALYDELVALETMSGIRLPDSPTRRVGGETLPGFKKYRHRARLYSMNKAQTTDQLVKWYQKIAQDEGCDPVVIVEYKYDGLTLCLTYEGGLLVRACTRGDGETGEDVTAQVATIKSVPLSIPFKGVCEITGEGIIRRSDFDRYNETAAEPLKNPRNAVAGAIRNLDPAVTASRRLSAVFYNVNFIEGQTFASQEAVNAFIKQNGFFAAPYIRCGSADELAAVCQKMDEERCALDFEIDGAAIKIDDMRLRDELGYTDKFPRYCIAFKFEADEHTTILSDVLWQVGRIGKLTPLAVLEPVRIGGATVSRATLNNASDIARKGVKIGSRVFVRRSNEVIPEITGVAEAHPDDRPIPVPDRCPACGAEVVESGAHIFCSNSDCPPKIIKTIQHFASKECMDLEGVSEKTAEQLYDKLGVRSPAALYALTAANLAALEGFKDKRTGAFLSELERSKTAPLHRVINALGIPNVGKKTAKDLADRFGSVSALRAAGIDELMKIDEVGEAVAQSIVEFFDKNAGLADALRGYGIDPQAEAAESSSISGLKFVITGTMSAPRAEIAARIEKKGGIVQSAVAKTTDCLIAGENCGSKLDKARALSIRIITEAELGGLLE